MKKDSVERAPASEGQPGLETRLVHAGANHVDGAVVTPVFQTAQFEFAGETDYHDLRYIRLNNGPNHRGLHEKLAAIEGAEAALVTASGMAAISTALLAVLSPGDHLLAQDCLYGGTHDLVTKDLPELGIEHDFVDGDAPSSWKAKLRPRTRAFYVETLSNPLVQMPDLEAAVEFARSHELVTLIDNTFASPVNFRPIEHGFDLSLHSATKYLNGHSDIVAGAVIGRADLVDRVRRKLNHLGGCLDPHACFLLDRGLKTLALRVRHQNASALALARFLEAHPAVARVSYPGLESHPAHARAKRLLQGSGGGFGGMLALELAGGAEAARRFAARTRIFLAAPSLGGAESLVTLPATTSHVGLAPAERERLGITEGLVRLSVGLETPADLIEDARAALEG
jgi:cystathionine beta-lyase/cystathionine gamma-synthase